MAEMTPTVRKTIRDPSNPLELRELNRQLEWVWRKLLGGLDAKAFSDGGMRQVTDTVERIVSTNVTADSIETDFLSAAIAKMMVAVIGICDADYLSAVDAKVENLIVRKGLGNSFTFENLKILYAQIVSATIGELCIKASDGNYYTLDVDANGKVSATLASVSEDEIAIGHTDAGKVILGTDIVAEELSTGDLFATFALVDKIDAARINVDTLVARAAFVEKLFATEAFIDRLATSSIVGGRSLTAIAGTAYAAKSAADTAQSAADTAQSAAETAQGTADGAMLATAHVGVNPPEAPIPAGRQWLDQGVEPWTLRSWIGADVRTEPEYAQTHSGNPVVLDDGRVLSLDSIRNSFGPVQSGSGDPSPNNIRPISGWTRAKLTRCGKNLLPNTTTDSTINGIEFTRNDDGTVTANGTLTSRAQHKVGEVELPAGDYILSSGFMTDTNTSGTMYASYLKDGSIVYVDLSGNSKKKFILAEKTTVTVSMDIRRVGITVTDLIYYPMIRIASNPDATYEPYTGDTYTADFGQTVYGGTLDWAAGVLTVEWGCKAFNGTEPLSAENDYYVFWAENVPQDAINVPGICSHYPYKKYYVSDEKQYGLNISYGIRFHVDKSVYPTADDFKSYLAAQHAAGTPVQVCYRLAEPVVVQLNLPAVYPLEGTNVLYGGAGALEVDSTASGWRVVNDPAELQSAQEALALQQARMDEALNQLGMAMVLDADGVHVHRPVTNPPCETLTADDSFNVLVNSAIAATFAASYQKMGGQIVVRQTSNGLIFGG